MSTVSLSTYYIIQVPETVNGALLSLARPHAGRGPNRLILPETNPAPSQTTTCLPWLLLKS